LASRRSALAVSAVFAAYVVGAVQRSVQCLRYGRQLRPRQAISEVLYLARACNSSVAFPSGMMGRGLPRHGRWRPPLSRTTCACQRCWGHIARCFTEPASVLVVGFGAGVTAGPFVLHPDIDKITICKIEP